MKDSNVCILDYGSGNVISVFNLLKTLTPDVVISNRSQDIIKASHIILPGVGAFGTSMEKIKRTIPLSILEDEVIKNQKPFLGICVGMQVLSEKGNEFGQFDGLGWIKGTVEKLNTGTLPLPHVGWNDVNIENHSPLLDKFKAIQDFYFVHSFVFKSEISNEIIATTDYGEKFTSIIAKNNIFGVQFHPEKSQKAGQALIQNFLNIK